MKITLTIIIFLLSSSCIVNASVFYVRDGGGSVYSTTSGTNKCNGTVDVIYSSGVSPNCAVSHPDLIMGIRGNNGQDVAGHWVAGDTLSIDGNSDTSPGTQASYIMGYSMPGSTSGACNVAFEYDCYLPIIPGGTDAAHPTSIIGTGTHKPMLLAVNGPSQGLLVNNNYVTLTSLEITDHDSVGYQNPVHAGGTGDGIQMAGDGFTFTDLYIHGFPRFGINMGQIASATFTRVWTIGNAYGGITVGNGGSTSVTGTLTFNQPIVEWNGCLEGTYPLSGGIDNPSNYSNCYGQGSNGYGDGLAFGAGGSQAAGNWTITGPGSISFNTQDGLDTLHGAGNGTMQVDKIRFEGNAGNQVKMNAATASLTNSVVIGDCGWWFGASQSTSGGMGTADSCRALGDVVLFNVTNGNTTNIFNNTIISNGNIMFESKDFSSTGCNGSTVINLKNNIALGGYAWFDDTTWNGAGGNAQTTYIYNAGNDGNGGGTCGTLTWTEDYNVVKGTKNSNSGCVGTHDKCNTDPGFTGGTFPVGSAGGAANTYYQGQSGVTLVPITTGSAAKNAGVAGLSYWNDGNDYYKNVRNNPPSIGAMEFNSLAANAFAPCFFNSDCSSNTCTANVCVGSGAASTQDTFSGNLTIKGITLK